MANPNPNWRDYEPVIGIETHVQLRTKSKLFCACNNDDRLAEPNTLVCPICMGLPGVLPKLNRAAVEQAIRAGLILNCQVAAETKFDRKNYFYPDLPKGYQISQYDQPLNGKGEIDVPGPEGGFKVGITRAHLEEDAAKIVHPKAGEHSLVDFNRAGSPLLEIVSEPDMHSGAEAKAYVQELYNLMRYGQVSNVDLYHGNMRFDVNVSVREYGAKELGTRSEIKNLNSFKSVERSIDYEIERQIGELEKGGSIIQETRGWDEAKGKTVAQRSKEEVHDYRYFPEPDIPPLKISDRMKEEVRSSLPKLPAEIRQELAKAGLSIQQAQALLLEPELVKLFLEASQRAGAGAAKRIANWLIRDVKAVVGVAGFDWSKFKLDGPRLVKLAAMVEEGELSSNGAEQVLSEMITGTRPPQDLAKAKKLLQVSDTGEMEKLVSEVIKANPDAAKDYQAGNQKSLQFLVGQVMKASKGRANPQLATKLLVEQLAREK